MNIYYFEYTLKINMNIHCHSEYSLFIMNNANASKHRLYKGDFAKAFAIRILTNLYIEYSQS